MEELIKAYLKENMTIELETNRDHDGDVKIKVSIWIDDEKIAESEDWIPS
jgi:hypothetical protein